MTWYAISLYGTAVLSVAAAIVVSVLAVRFYREN